MASARTRELVEDLVAALHMEARALASGDDGCIPDAAARKADLLRDLTERAQRADVDDAHVRSLLQQARALNDLNGTMLAARLAVTRARSDALLQAASAMAVYGASGQIDAVGAGTAGAAIRPAVTVA
jgi:flagellar biosynthesis/type III secretory pathway chaperone